MEERKSAISCGACGPLNYVGSSCERDFGPEWANDGYNNCGQCAGGFGTFAICKRVAYLGDPNNCCLYGDSGDPRKTCDPKFQIGAGECHKYLANYCTPDRMWNDPRCALWLQRDPNSARENARRALTKLDARAAQQWCREQSAKGNPVCDTPAVEYCRRNPDDPFCKCINSPANSKNIANPRCFDGDCIRFGYLTQNMRTPCPNVVDCSTQVNLQNAGISALTNLNINQQCGNAPGDSSDSNTQPKKSNTSLIIIIFLAVLILAVGGISIIFILLDESPALNISDKRDLA